MEIPLRKKIRNYSFFIEHSCDLWIILTADFEVIEINPKALDIFKLKAPKENNLSFSLILDRATHLKKMFDNVAILDSKLKATHSQSLKIKDEVNDTPLVWEISYLLDEKNEISHFLLLGHEINGDKARESYFALESMIAHLPGNVYWLDKNCIQLGCNNNVLNMLGISREDYVGKSYEELAKIVGWTQGEEQAFKKADLEVLESGKPKFSVEEPPVKHKDGSIHYYLTTRVPLRNKKRNIVGVAGISIDITERKKIEEELKVAKERAEVANNLKSQFIQNMQHDMRTPTAGLFHLFDFIRKARDQEEFLEMLTLGENATKELLALCDTLVDFEKIQYGNQTIINDKLSVNEIIERVCNLNLAAIKEKNLKLTVEIGENVPLLIKGDDFRLYKILTNLLGNSIKFTLKGEIKITAQLVSIKKNKVVIEFGVHDTGPGIPADRIDLIFEKFVRLNPSNQGLYKGSGLGLSIVKKCVEELEGEIDIESEVGKGTSFYVTIPFEKALGSRPPRKANFEKEKNLDTAPSLQEEEIFNIANMQTTNQLRENKKNESLNVLLIEDDKLAATAAKAALISTNCQVTLAENVAQAKEKLNEHLFDLVISDIGLPDGTGFDIITCVKNDPKHRNYATPFIALTAHTSEDIKQKANSTGFAHLFHKPINPQRIQTVLDIYIEERKEDQSTQSTVNHDEEPILDFELTQQLSGGREDVAKELLEMLVKITPEDLHALEQAIQKGNSKAAREVLHKIKGGLSYCGAPRFKHAIIHLHEQVKASEEVTIWKKAFSEVMKEWEHLVQAYKELVAK